MRTKSFPRTIGPWFYLLGCICFAYYDQSHDNVIKTSLKISTFYAFLAFCFNHFSPHFVVYSVFVLFPLLFFSDEHQKYVPNCLISQSTHFPKTTQKRFLLLKSSVFAENSMSIYLSLFCLYGSFHLNEDPK